MDNETAIGPATATRTVHLRSGGSVTLLASFDLFALKTSDRDLISELLDVIENYESGRGGYRHAEEIPDGGSV